MGKKWQKGCIANQEWYARAYPGEAVVDKTKCNSAAFAEAKVVAPGSNYWPLSEFARAECTGVEAGSVRNSTACDSLIGEQDAVAVCFEKYAEESGDRKACGKLKGGGSIDTCLKNVGVRYNDTLACKQIESIAGRSDCLTVIATNKKDPLVCDEIRQKIDADDTNPDTDLNRCWKEVASTTENPSHCEGIPNNNVRDYCWFRAASKNKESSFCQKIVRQVGETSREQCLRMTETRQVT